MIQKKWQGCIGKVRFCYSDASSFSLHFLPNVTFHKSLRQCNMKGWSTGLPAAFGFTCFSDHETPFRFLALIKMHCFTTFTVWHYFSTVWGWWQHQVRRSSYCCLASKKMLISIEVENKHEYCTLKCILKNSCGEQKTGNFLAFLSKSQYLGILHHLVLLAF